MFAGSCGEEGPLETEYWTDSRYAAWDAGTAGTGAWVKGRWEQGSNYHWPDLREAAKAPPLPDGARLFGSGRIALGELLEWGFRSRGWHRLWVPSYYCEDVVQSLRRSRVQIGRYPCGPAGEVTLPAWSDGDVLLRVGYFGWGLVPLAEAWPGEVIEDHTHDPFGAVNPEADFVFASLRKTLPVPDGAVCWSPRGFEVPEEPATRPEHTRAVMQRIAAMALKRHYLLGGLVGKAIYRELEMEAEHDFLEGVSAPMSEISRVMLQHLPVAAARAARGTNFAAFREAMAGDPNLTVLGPVRQEAPAVAVVRIREAGRRDVLRTRLADEGIYTAVLWPVPEDGAPWHRPEDADFAASTLAVHVDFRYRPEDLERVAERMCSLSRSLLGAAG